MSICSSRNRILNITISIIALAIMATIPSVAMGQDLIVSVGDTVALPGQMNTPITTYLTNYEDTVSAFEMWLRVESHEIMYFQNEEVEVTDTTYWVCTEWDPADSSICWAATAGEHETTYWQFIGWDTLGVPNDSIRVQEDDPWDVTYPPNYNYTVITTDTVFVGAIDTVGTLIGGWERVTTRTLEQNQDSTKFYAVKIIAQANASFTDGHTTIGIPAGQVGGVLFRLNANIEPIDDTVIDRSVNINILSTPPDNFVFSRPSGGASIGLAYRPFVDTNFYQCQAWDQVDPDLCANWERVSSPPPDWDWDRDSIYVFDDSQPYIDTMVIDTITWLPTGTVEINHGSLTVLLILDLCGNVDNSEDEKINLADITSLIGSVYLNGSESDPACVSNINCDELGKINLADITRLIDHVYLSKAPLCEDCCLY